MSVVLAFLNIKLFLGCYFTFFDLVVKITSGILSWSLIPAITVVFSTRVGLSSEEQVQDVFLLC